MTSVQTHIKQQNILWSPLPGSSNVVLFQYDTSNNNFSSSTVTVSSSSSNLAVFRDLGVVHTSAGRTFRKIQLLTAGSPATFGVTGAPATGRFDNSYKTYYYENSIENGLATTSALFRIR